MLSTYRALNICWLNKGISAVLDPAFYGNRIIDYRNTHDRFRTIVSLWEFGNSKLELELKWNAFLALSLAQKCFRKELYRIANNQPSRLEERLYLPLQDKSINDTKCVISEDLLSIPIDVCFLKSKIYALWEEGFLLVWFSIVSPAREQSLYTYGKCAIFICWINNFMTIDVLIIIEEFKLWLLLWC